MFDFETKVVLAVAKSDMLFEAAKRAVLISDLSALDDLCEDLGLGIDFDGYGIELYPAATRRLYPAHVRIETVEVDVDAIFERHHASFTIAAYGAGK